MGHQFVPSDLDTKVYNKEVGKIGDYDFSIQIQSRLNGYIKPLAM